MIDAATFANLYSAFWRSTTPTCELFVRRMNLGELDRFDTPMSLGKPASSAALVAETGFSAFVFSTNDSALKENPKLLFDLALADSKRRLQVVRGRNVDDELTDADRQDALMLSDRLHRFFSYRRGRLLTRPRFPGCGFVDESEGDVLSGNTLFEVKSVERGFRSSDIHQLITYYCLSVSAERQDINALGLLNPKRGLSFELGVDQLCNEIAGITASELSNEVIRALSSGDISR